MNFYRRSAWSGSMKPSTSSSVPKYVAALRSTWSESRDGAERHLAHNHFSERPPRSEPPERELDGSPAEWSGVYQDVHEALEDDIWIVGRVTMAEMTKAR
jgi:hypothetical protein